MLKGNIHVVNKEFGEAFKAYNLLIKLNSEYVDGYLKLGDLNFIVKNYEKAISLYDIALEKDCRYIEALK